MEILRYAFIAGVLVFGVLGLISSPRALYQSSPRQIYQNIRSDGPPRYRRRHGLYAALAVTCAIGIYLTS